MARIDRYMLSHLLTLFGFFSLILVMIYWINRAVRLFDQLIADGQSAWVFLELTSLSLPSIIRIVLPLSAFVAAVYATNRLSADSELTVIQAMGVSPFRLARPVLYFGVIVAVLMSILTHILVPLSTQQLSERTAQIAQNMSTRLLTPGVFTSPADGVTFYIRDISAAGEMLDLFIEESNNPVQRVTYTASRAYLVRTDNGPQLVMVDGLTQTLNRNTGRLITTAFEDFVYDVGAFIAPPSTRGRSARTLMTPDLLAPSAAILAETGQTQEALLLLAHDRIAQAGLGFVAGLVGFSALIAGGFSRFGLWRNIGLAVGLVILLKACETVGAGMAQNNAALWPMMYLAVFAGVILSGLLLFAAQTPYLFKRRPRATARAAQGAS